MLDGTDILLLLEWQAFYELEPFGEIRDDLRFAGLGLKICSALGAKGEGGKALTLQDFMLDFSKKAEPEFLDPHAVRAQLKELYGKK